MFAKASGACFGVAGVLAGLAIATASLNRAGAKDSAGLDALTLIFVVAALALLGLGVLFGLAVAWTLVWRYFHAVDVPSGQWYCRYWPGERIAQVTGVGVTVREGAGTVRVNCHAQFKEEEVSFALSLGPHVNGTLNVDFPQQKVHFASDLREGDPAEIVVIAEPSWWRGRPSKREQRIAVGITDHRPAVTPEEVRAAIARIDPLISEAQALLEACGRPREQMIGADPMYFLHECVPRINKFAQDATVTISEVAPEFLGKLQNVGNVTHNTDVKPAMIQHVEKLLENLGAIQDELRKRL